MEQTKLSEGFKKILVIICIILLLVLIYADISYCSNYTNDNEDIIDSIEQYDNNINNVTNKSDSIYYALLDEMDSYIKTKAPKVDTSVFKHMVTKSIDHNIDLCFMMAQTELETRYGTLGAGKNTSRRSLFGVYNKKYISYELAIDDYCRLLNKYYIGRGKTEKHLLNNYVTHSGARYAENPNYESSLRKIYNYIIKQTNIDNLYNDLLNNLNNKMSNS